MNIKEAARWLRERDNFLLLTHRRPDGDTLCSAAGLARGLMSIGKKAYILPNPEATDRYVKYMGGYFAPNDFVPEHIVSIDMASENMFPDNAERYVKSTELCIDHHLSNSGYAENSCVMPECAACGELIYMLLMELVWSIDKETAGLLYIAVSTDTGCFAYANTTAQTLGIASKLVAAGAENAEINKFLFRTKAKSRIELEGRVLSSIRFFREGTIAVATVTRKMMEETGASEDAMDDIASLPGQIEGVEAGITVKEMVGGGCKISLRTVRRVNASQVCARFGGGGHMLAAGCNMSCTVEEAAERMAEAVDACWDTL